MSQFDIRDFKVGDRVELHPGTDRWMRGDRYGDVVYVGSKLLSVAMTRSGKTVRVLPANIGQLNGGYL